jgi:hypothetical protein
MSNGSDPKDKLRPTVGTHAAHDSHDYMLRVVAQRNAEMSAQRAAEAAAQVSAAERRPGPPEAKASGAGPTESKKK